MIEGQPSRTAMVVALMRAAHTRSGRPPYNAAASFYRRRERWTDAVATYYKLITANPDAMNAHLRLGDVYVNNLKTYD